MKKTFTLFVFTCLFFVVQGATFSVTSTPGGLSSAITAAGGDLATITDLTVTGTMDARDFVTMRDDMPLLANLDLSDATIAAGTNIPGTNGTADYPANEIPQCAFYTLSTITGKASLATISMPLSVTSIGDGAFAYCSGFTGSLTISPSVISIGDYAFMNCSGFTGTLNIPSAVTSIGNFAFTGCSGFDGLSISSSVTSIGESAFMNCSGFKGALVIPSSVILIGNNAFNSCSGFDGALTISSSVTSIGGGAFSNCSGLTGSLTIQPAVTSIGDYAFSGCSSLTGSLTIPSSVTSIGDEAFAYCSGFTGSLTISPSVISIGDNTFMNCSGFTGTLNIPSAVTSIGNFAFTGCSSFDGLTISSSVTSIGESAFLNCSGFKGALIIPSSVTSIGRYAFNGCSGFDGALTISSSVTSIGEGTFSNCSGLTGSLTIPPAVTFIGNGAFSGCSSLIGSFIIPSSVTSIEANAFMDCSGLNGTLTIPSSVTYIDSYAFSNCSGLVGSLIIPSSVTVIGENAFSGCSSFTGSLTIPSSVTAIYDNAFSGCSSLTGIKVYKTTPSSIELAANVFDGIPTSTCVLHVPVGKQASYAAADQWSAFTTVSADLLVAPAVTTQAVSNISFTTATGKVDITDLGAPDPTAYGVCWKIGSTPTISDSEVHNGTVSMVGEYTVSMTGLAKNTTYKLRAYATNTAGTSYGDEITFTTLAQNAPTDIALSTNSIIENVAANSIVGTFSSTDPDGGNAFTYSLVSGTGSTDNASFNVSGNNLQITNSPDSEAKNSYLVRVRSTSNGALFYEKAFTITINDVNETPTDIALSASAIDENVAANSIVGTFSSTDPDAGNAFTYTLVSGDGSADNASFNISGNSLQITNSPDRETKNSYSVRVRTTDQGGLFFEKALTITINNVNETPTDIALSASAIDENVTANSVVGTISSTDPDASNTFTYTLVSGDGSADNASFNISGNSLQITNSPDYEAKNSYVVRVRTTDQGGLFFEKALTISINDVNEAPITTTLAVSSVTSSVAILNGSVNPNNVTSVVTFEYGTSTSYGTSTTAIQSPVAGTSATSVNSSITGLTPNTTYHFRVKAVNVAGTTYGADATFTTLAVAPTATSIAASSISGTTATLNGTINANNASTTVTFEYGLTTSYGTIITADQSPVTGTSANAVSYALTGLTPNTTYHYRVVGVNAEGTTNGADMTFRTNDIAPNISYVTPQSYVVGTPIAALTPTNTGGAVVAISSPQVSTLAGSGDEGSADGLGTAASFNIPVFLAPDAAGNLYVSDLGNNMIRKITPAGGVSTLANASAGFNEPAGIAVDPSGNVYVAENENHRIRKITPAGVVSTLAGSDNVESGNTNGSGTAARFSGPAGLALDAAGNLYVSDNGNKQIRKITPAGEVTTFAGSGTSGSTDGNGTSASFKSPLGMVIDASGNLYVVDSRSNLIRKISPTGDVTTFAGSGAEGSTNGNGTLASFNAPEGIAIDASGNLYIADSENNLIRKINPSGVVSTLAGNGSQGADNGAAETASFGLPYGVTVDASGNLYVADTFNNLIRKITQSAYTITPALPAGLSFDGARGTISGTPTAASAATTYTVSTTNSGGSSTTTISITVKNPQTITFDALPTKTYGDAAFNLAATSTSGLPVSYSSDNTAVARVSGTTVTIVGAGTANITAAQAGDATNLAAANVAQQLTVSKKALTVTAVTDTKTYDGTTASTAVPTVGTLASDDAINVAPTQVFDNINAGTNTLTASGLTIKRVVRDNAPVFDKASVETIYKVLNTGVDMTSNYDISYVSAAGTINKQALTVTAATDTKTYDGTAVSNVAPAVGVLVVGDEINAAPTQVFDNINAGTNALTASGLTIKKGNTDVTDNYDIGYVSATGTINKLAVTVTAVTDTKTYDGTTVSTAIPTVGTLATGDAINGAPTQVFDNASVGTTRVLTASGLIVKNDGVDVTSNYDISYVTAIGTINKLTVTVTAATDTKTYDGTTVSTAIPTVGTLATGDAINGAPTQVFDNASVGTTHVLTASGLTIKKGSTDATGNYDISYATATGTINKLTVTVTAATDTKTYDGTTDSKVTPTVGTLAVRDAIATAPTQAFDNAAVGTTHVLTASGLILKNDGADVTSNYDISYVSATGTINKLAVTVTAATDTKTYDGTTVSTAVPTVGTLATGDAISTAPTQAFDNAAVGTTHVLTALGLTIKNGSADVTGNYDINYATANGSITAKLLTIATPSVTLSKVYDGNTVAAVTAVTLSGLVAGDAGKVTIAASASYDNATVGTNKMITVTYSLVGSAAGNYGTPADVVVTGAEITSATITLEPLLNPTPSATNNDLVLSYNVVAGGPTQYKITFEAAALTVGMQNVSYTVLATTGADGKITISVPKGTRPGKYKGTLQMRNNSGVESTAYDFVLTVNIPTEYLAVKYNRVLVLDNSTKIFKSYQWYKDGVAIEGATKQFYRDPKGLVGTYSMQAIDIDGEIIYSFPKELNIPITQKVTAYPSLVRANQTCTVEITDEAMELDLKGAELSVYSSQGIRVYHSTKVESLNAIQLPAMAGIYSGRITTADGQSFIFKVIVAN